MTPNVVPDGTKQKATVRRAGMASLMSNAKWRKVLGALDRPDVEIARCIVKFVGDDEPREMITPCPASFRGDKYFETSFPPMPFIAIEWLEWPDAILERRGEPGVPAMAKAQDTSKARTIIEALGSFPLQVTASGLRIVGHTRQPLD